MSPTLAPKMEGEQHGPSYGSLGDAGEATSVMNGGARAVEQAEDQGDSRGEVTAMSGANEVDGTTAHGRDVLTTTAPARNVQREAAETGSLQPSASQQSNTETHHAPRLEQIQQPPTTSEHVEQVRQHVSMSGYEFSPPEELPETNSGRPGQASGQAMWLVKLGEFVQKRITQAGAVVSPLLESRSRPSTQPAGLTPPASWSGQQATSTRLFSPAAERQMQQWIQRAPLLHGTPPQPQHESGSSTSSVTQEQILLEVQRRVRQEMSEFAERQNLLISENDQLKEMIANLLQAQRAGDSERPVSGMCSGPQGGARGLSGPELARIPEDPVRDLGGTRGNLADLQPAFEEPVRDLAVQQGSFSLLGGDDSHVRPCEGQLRPPPGLQGTQQQEQGNRLEPGANAASRTEGVGALPGVRSRVVFGGASTVPTTSMGHSLGACAPQPTSMGQMWGATTAPTAPMGQTWGATTAPTAPVDQAWGPTYGPATSYAANASTEIPAHSTSASAPWPATQPVGTASTSSGPPMGGSATKGPLDILVQGMTQLQQAYLGKPEGDLKGSAELPSMPEVGADAAVEFSDWIYEAEQVIGSLSDKAALWFSACLEVARNTYDQYVVSSPLQRLSLTPSIPDELRDPRWSRLEKKVTMMLLAAMCKPAKDEVITHRISTVPSLLYRLFVLYQPGGSAERGTILRHLEGHSAGNDVYQCITALRKWRRYLQRAEDIGISVPDGSVLLKGVEAITAQALEALPDVKFRVALAKNDLQLHSRPEADSVIRYSNAIMAELQTAAPVRRTGSTSEPARLKNINAAEAPGTSSPSAKAKAKASIPCKFFLTETGCSRGASCGYSHQFTKKEKAGRCWTCGSTQHLSSTCTAKKGGNSPSRDPKTGPKGQPTKGPAVSQLAAATASMSSAPSTLDNSSMVSSSLPSTSSSSAPGPSISEVVAATTGDTEAQMKQLLEEANAMMKEMRKLKMLALSSTEVENNAVARRCGPMSGRTGLLDSGASHPFRSASTDELQEATRVKVQLANGSEVTLAQNRAGTLLASTPKDGDELSPIVPLGSLVSELGCDLVWTRKRGLEIRHPQHGLIKPRIVGQCPVIGESRALDFIREMEERKLESLVESTRTTARSLWLWNQAASWSGHLQGFLEDGTRASQLQALSAEDSPFKYLSDSEKSALAEGVELDDKAGWNYLKAIPCSRQKRKRLMNMPWVIHLFAGEGKNADPVFKELEDSRVLVEVDIAKSMAFDLFKVSGAYRALLWAAATGRVDGILGAPPCRRESDSVLLLKQIWLFTVAKAARAMSAEQPVFMMIEGARLLKDIHSKDYDRWPSIKEAWGGILESLCLEEFSPNIVTNLQLGDPVPDCGDCSRRWTESFRSLVRQAVHLWDATPEGLQVTKWMKRLASGDPDYLQGFSEKELEMWKNHVQNNHRPFHRRCRTCVVSKGTGRIHRRVRHPDVHCLSLDIMGPFREKSADPNHRDYRYMLIGTYTMPKMTGELEEDTPGSPVPEDVSRAVAEEEQADDSGKCEDQLQEAPPVEDEWDELDTVELRKETCGDSAGDLKGLTEEEFEKIFSEVGKPYDVQVIYVSMPLRGRTSARVQSAVQEVFLKLRSEGLQITRIHADRAREFRTESLKRWVLQHGAFMTFTEGQAPQQNGRAEAAVRWIKGEIRMLLQASGLPKACWAMAGNYATAWQRAKALGTPEPPLPFGTDVHIRSKVYGTGQRYDLDSRWRKGTYVGPSFDVRGGHVIKFPDNTYTTTKHLRPNLVNSDGLVDLGTHEALIPLPPRRLRKKSTVEQEPMASQEENVGPYDPEHAAERYAAGLLEEDELVQDQIEILVHLLPSVTEIPRSFGEQEIDSKIWTTGAFVHGGVVGVKRATTTFPLSTRVMVKYVKQIAPDLKFKAVTVNVNVKAQEHKDVHNVGTTMITALSHFKGGGLDVIEDGNVRRLELGAGPCFFDPHNKHSTVPWTEGNRAVLLAYSIRDSGKLAQDKIDLLTDLGFCWVPHLSATDRLEERPVLSALSVNLLVSDSERDLPPPGPSDSERDLPPPGPSDSERDLPPPGPSDSERDLPPPGPSDSERDLPPPGPSDSGRDLPPPGLSDSERDLPPPKGASTTRPLDGSGLPHVSQDMDIAIQDLEEKAERLRSLLEEEEILVEQYSRVESESRGHLEDTRSQISEFLDYIHEELIGLEKVRTAACLNTVTKCSSSRTSESGSEDVDYEKLLDELEDDLRVVHTVPVAQVKRVLERWVESIKKEVENLFASKTLRRVTAEEARRLEKSGQVVFAPAKCVFTLKPPQEAGRRAKRKCRLVICGNHVERGQEGQEDLYAAGTSSDSLRMSLVIAATRGWLGAISDVTGAFLLATWPEGKTRYGFFPPKVVRDSGFGEGEAWIIERPIYGLRESPKIWSDFRNKRLRSARVKYGDIILVLRPTIVEPELWMILCEVTGVLYGLMVLYVDDILYLSNREVITAIHEFVTSEWPTSPLEWLEEHKAVRYLGVEILREPRIDSHGNQYHVYTIGQSAYVQDLLRSHDMQEVHPTQLPVPREWVEEAEASEEVEEGFTEETLRRAQRVVGEGLWLSTRTRPDILYVINHLASLVAKRPDYVLRVGKRLLAYLAGTKDLRLQLGAPHDDDHAVTCYTDASYAPFGKRSFGAAVICLHGSPISWKAGRQSFVTLSVMEAELYAATQGCLLLEGVYALANEVLPGRYCRVLAVDNTSAVAMLTGGHGSQRTRHLKIRANYVREAVEQGWLVVRHVEGDQQLADLATKLQPRLRLQQLLRLWNFTGSCISSALMTMQAKVLMILATLASLVCPTRAEDTSRTKDPVPVASWDELLIFVMMIALIAVGVWELIKYVSKMIWKKIKMAKKAKKIQRFGDFATEVARQEIRSQEAVRSRRSLNSVVEAIERTPTTPMEQEQHQELSTSTLRQRSSMTSFTPSPTQSSSSFSATVERQRVAVDMLNLMTVEELKVGLRCEGCPVSGNKADLARRLAECLKSSREGDERDLPTMKQMKYVLWLYRTRSLSGRCKLVWADLNTKSRISGWIALWKSA